MASKPRVNLFEAGAAAAESNGGDGGPSDAVVSFKAGAMTVSGTTVTAQPGRGRLVLRLDEDSLVHVAHLSRPAGESLLDVVVFPGDAELEGPLAACTTGRVYVLRLKGSGRTHLFWSQEPVAPDGSTAAHDARLADIVAKFNTYMNDPAAAAAARRASMMSPAELQNMFDRRRAAREKCCSLARPRGSRHR